MRFTLWLLILLIAGCSPCGRATAKPWRCIEVVTTARIDTLCGPGYGFRQGSDWGKLGPVQIYYISSDCNYVWVREYQPQFVIRVTTIK